MRAEDSQIDVNDVNRQMATDAGFYSTLMPTWLKDQLQQIFLQFSSVSLLSNNTDLIFKMYFSINNGSWCALFHSFSTLYSNLAEQYGLRREQSPEDMQCLI